MAGLNQTSTLRLKSGKPILFYLAVFLLTVCSNTPPDTAKENSTSPAQSLTEKFAELVPDGWDVYDRIQVFSADNLYEHIDGRAELYLAYDVKNLTAATLEKKSDIGEFMELSVYDMETPTNAFGIFSVERTGDEISLDLGRESYRSGSSVFIWKGKFYTTIVTPSDSEESLRVSLDLAQKVTALLTDSGEPVWGFSALPRENRMPGSMKYFKVDAMGLDFMPNTFTALYKKDKTEILVFLSHQASTESAGNSVIRYSEYAAQYGRGIQVRSLNGVELIQCDMDGSYDVIFQKGRLVGGVQAVISPSTALEAAAELWAQIDSE